MLYRSYWLVAGEVRQTSPARRVPWGPAVLVPKSNNLAMAIRTRARPSSILVQAYSNKLERTGEPSGEPFTTQECPQQALVNGSRHCGLLEDSRRGLILPLVRLRAGTVRLTVNIAWVETGTTSTGRRVLHDEATWLFTLRITGPMPSPR